MCIAILSTAHPSYKLIVINNRDVCGIIFANTSAVSTN